MSELKVKRSVVHASFTITRHWQASPARVFQAFADQKKKDAWFGGGSDWTPVGRSFDFREGGRETLTGKWNTGMVTRFDCVYRDIVAPISVSQAAIELKPDNGGTKFILTEYGDYLDGYDDAGSREHGTNALMDALEKSLAA